MHERFGLLAEKALAFRAKFHLNIIGVVGRILFPLSLPGLFAGLLIVFVLCLGFYVTPAILGGGRVIMAAMKISSNIELYFSWGAASALGVVLLIVTAIILYIASKLVSLDQFGNK